MDNFFTIAFVIEMAMKLIGLGLVQYISDGWNVLDGSLVLSSVLDKFLTAIAESGLPISPTFLRMLRFFRIVRLLKLVSASSRIKRPDLSLTSTPTPIPTLTLALTHILTPTLT